MTTQNTQGDNSKNTPRCQYCGKEPHSRESCPAQKSVCHVCKLRGHWARTKVCKGKRKGYAPSDEVTEEMEDEVGGLFLGSDSE